MKHRYIPDKDSLVHIPVPNLFCTRCEDIVRSYLQGWVSCNCSSREIKPMGQDNYPSHWIDPTPAETFDTLEEKYL